MEHTVKPFLTGRVMAALLTAIAAGEYGGLLWWGAVWPWKHLAAYPGDEGLNRYMVLASVLLVCVSLAAAAAHRRETRLLPWVAALIVALPVAVVTLLLFLNLAFLDPVVYYLALLPAVAAVLAPYRLAARLTHGSAKRRNARTP